MKVREIASKLHPKSPMAKLGFTSSPAIDDAAKREARGRSEQAVIDKLSPFAHIPATEIFKQVVLSCHERRDSFQTFFY
jgi:hypothetical protein